VYFELQTNFSQSIYYFRWRFRVYK